MKDQLLINEMESDGWISVLIPPKEKLRVRMAYLWGDGVDKCNTLWSCDLL